MLAFEIEVDGERACIAGIEDWSLLTFHLDAMRNGSSEEIWLSMGGMSQDDENRVAHHVRWGRIDLCVGSRVTLTVVNTDEPDPPLRRYRSDREVQENPYTEEEWEEMERSEWMRLKAKFEPDNTK